MGTTRRRGSPRNSVLPKSDDKLIEDVEGRMRWQDDMRKNEQTRNATNRLGASFKRKRGKHNSIQKNSKWSWPIRTTKCCKQIRSIIQKKEKGGKIAFNKISNENDQLMDAKKSSSQYN